MRKRTANSGKIIVLVKASQSYAGTLKDMSANHDQ